MTQNLFAQWLKRKIRETEALLNPQTQNVVFFETSIRLQRSFFWQPRLVEEFKKEIAPYHEALASINQSKQIFIDAGAAEGHFAISTALLHKNAQVYAFEPSPRQRTLLQRNTRHNNVSSRVFLEPYGLFNRKGILSFRTAGAASFLEDVSNGAPKFPCLEKVQVVRLDDWFKTRNIDHVDVIKMDIEGAEIEALEGAREVLLKHQPICLIQAYHLRDNKRTLEPCANFLKSIGYQAREWEAPSGFLVATGKN
jgi:FkbM family methyltransferase